jgi:hydrogenase 3 maturation protease
VVLNLVKEGGWGRAFARRQILREVVLGIGNVLRSDDGVGVYVVQKLDKYLSKINAGKGQATLDGQSRELIPIQCDTIPEGYTALVREHKPDLLVMVDAAEMGLNPGECRIIPPNMTEMLATSTHNISLSFLVTYLQDFCREIIMVGIQPQSMVPGVNLSGVVRESGDRLVALITKGQLAQIKKLDAL